MTSLRLFSLKCLLRNRIHHRIRGGWRLAAFLAKPFGSLPLDSQAGVPIFLNIQSLDEHAVTILLGHGDYHERGEQKLLRELVREGDTVYDIGANLGIFTLLFSAAVGQRGCVVAVEPNPALTDNLARTCSSLSQVRLHQCALAEAAGEALFYVPEDDHMLASLADWSGQKTRRINIPVSTLDHLVVQYPPPVMVKIDVEGAEYLVLRGAANLMSSPCPPMVFFEQIPAAANSFGYPPCAAQRWIAATGKFKLYRIRPEGDLELLKEEYQGPANLLAVPDHLCWRVDQLGLRR